MTITMSSAHSSTFLSLYLRHSSFSNNSVTLPTSQLIPQATGTQEWHIVPLLGDVTSSTTAVQYVSVSELRVLSTEKQWPVRREHTVYTNKSWQCKEKYIVHHWTSMEASLRHSSGWGTWSVSPQYRDLRTRAPTLPLLHLRHSSFTNPSFASPTSLGFHLCHLASRPCPRTFLDTEWRKIFSTPTPGI